MLSLVRFFRAERNEQPPFGSFPKRTTLTCPSTVTDTDSYACTLPSAPATSHPASCLKYVKSKSVLEIQTDSAVSMEKPSGAYFDLPSHQEIAIEYDIPLFLSKTA